MEANKDQIEIAAKAIYLLFDLSDIHPWVEGGNSLMQCDARRYARAALTSQAAPQPAPAPAVAVDALEKFTIPHITSRGDEFYLVKDVLATQPAQAPTPCPDPAACQAHGCVDPRARCEEAAPAGEPVAKQANPHAATFPAEIWLQVGERDADECAPFEKFSEITWCWESIDSMDVRYVRADLAAPVANAGQAQEKSRDTKQSGIAARLPNGVCVTNVYEAYAAGLAQPAQLAGDERPQQRMFLDELDAANAGQQWIQQFAKLANRCEYTNDSGNQAPLVKWCAYFDVHDKLVAAYLLTRDLKNWTQLTTVDARAAIAAQQPAQADDAPTPARKVGGNYQADGHIVGRFKTRAGLPRLVFEFNNPAGMLHIFTPEQVQEGGAERTGEVK